MLLQKYKNISAKVYVYKYLWSDTISQDVRLQALTDTLKSYLELKLRAIAVVQSLTHPNAELVLETSFPVKTKSKSLSTLYLF